MKNYMFALSVVHDMLKEEGLPLDDKYALEASVEALEKQIPKQPLFDHWAPAICPSCGFELSDNLGDGYYEHRNSPVCLCGQRLVWDVTE